MANPKKDDATLHLPGTQKKGAATSTAKDQSAKARKREQRARDSAAVTETEPSEWPERICLMVLSAPEKNSLRQHALEAWHQIGRLRGFKLS